MFYFVTDAGLLLLCFSFSVQAKRLARKNRLRNDHFVSDGTQNLNWINYGGG